MSDTILEIENLSVGYNGKALSGPFNLSLPKGTTLGILGTNGSGKTTLMKTLLGLTAPLFGSYHWEPGSRFGFVPQESEIDSLFPLTLQDLLEMGAPRGAKTGTMEKILVQLGMEHLSNKLFRELSGGQKQRALVGRALMGNPEVLLFDEPFNNLDYAFRKKLMDQILVWNREKSMTVILIEHDINRILNEVDYMIILGPHESFAGLTRELLKEKTLEAAYEAPLHIHEENGKLQIHFL